MQEKIVLPSGGSIEHPLQKPIPDLSSESVSGWPAEVSRRDGGVDQSGRIRSPVSTSAAPQLGSVCEAALWRARAGLEISGALPASSCHLESPARVDGRGPGDFRIQGLHRWQSEEGYDSGSHGVHPALSAA